MTTDLSTETLVAPAPAGRHSMVRVFAPIIRDIALPLGAYYGLSELGYSDFAALLGGTLVGGALMAVDIIRSRRLEPFAVIMAGVFAFGLISSLITGDARLMIVKESFGTVIIGAAFLIGTMAGKPLTYLSARKVMAAEPAKLAAFEERYRTTPAMRRNFARLGILWGVVLLAEAAVRVVLAFQLPVHTMAWLSSVLMVAVMVPMIMLSAVLSKRMNRTTPAA
ncbi:VC0807 family protein [Nocardia sp. NPDC052566]|uniref:VC0807 family protein n=1 Tax=Nocardia sp. NPDC052566 TaxID=3364330 RepID=UPI0037CBE7DC